MVCNKYIAITCPCKKIRCTSVTSQGSPHPGFVAEAALLRFGMLEISFLWNTESLHQEQHSLQYVQFHTEVLADALVPLLAGKHEMINVSSEIISAKWVEKKCATSGEMQRQLESEDLRRTWMKIWWLFHDVSCFKASHMHKLPNIIQYRSCMEMWAVYFHFEYRNLCSKPKVSQEIFWRCSSSQRQMPMTENVLKTSLGRIIVTSIDLTGTGFDFQGGNSWCSAILDLSGSWDRVYICFFASYRFLFYVTLNDSTPFHDSSTILHHSTSLLCECGFWPITDQRYWGNNLA